MSDSNLTCVRKYDYYVFDLSKLRAKACCKSPFPSDSADFKEDLNTILFEREKLRQGVKIKSCETCWILEEQGQKSFRVKEALDSRRHLDQEHKPQLIEIIFGNKCNLKCIYCGPDSSSMWNNKLVQKAGLSSDILNFLENSWDNLGMIVLIGGEPALIPEIFNLTAELKKIEARKPSSKRKVLKVVSNFAVPTVLFKKFIDNLVELHGFAEIEIGISAEAIGDRFEYIRDGASFETFSQNLDYALAFPELNLALQSTISILSIAKFDEFLTFYIQKLTKAQRQIDFVYNEVVMPLPLAPRNFPSPLTDQKMKIMATLQSLPEGSIRAAKRFRAFKDSISRLYDEVAKSTLPFTYVSDFLDDAETRRLIQRNWRETFPELLTDKDR